MMMGRPVARTLAVLAAGLVFASPRPLQAQSQYLLNQMNQHNGTALRNGFQPVTAMVSGTLTNSSTTSHSVSLNAGRQYAIIGVCDADCPDLDLKLYGPDNSLIAQDIATDDYPTLTFTAAFTGNYRLEVIMATCRVNPCAYGVQLYGGAQGGGLQPLNQPAPMNQPVPMNQPTPMNQPMPMNQPTAIATPTSLPMLGQIGANQQVMGNLGMAPAMWNNKAIQIWGFQCAQGQTFQMDILSTWDNYAIIFDPNGLSVGTNDDGGEGTNARLLYTCQMSGLYRLGVTTYSSSTTAGAYTLQVQSAGTPPQQQQQQMNQPQPMNRPQQMTQTQSMPLPGASGATLPQPSSTGMNVVGTIAAPGQVAQINPGESRMGRLETGDQRMNDGTWADVWTFAGRQGQRVRIECRSEEFDTYLQLLDAQGARLAEDDDSLGDQNSLIEFTLPANGGYTIVVNNFGDDRRAGIYTLTLR
jgi:hypothetical protein